MKILMHRNADIWITDRYGGFVSVIISAAGGTMGAMARILGGVLLLGVGVGTCAYAFRPDRNDNERTVAVEGPRPRPPRPKAPPIIEVDPESPRELGHTIAELLIDRCRDRSARAG